MVCACWSSNPMGLFLGKAILKNDKNSERSNRWAFWIGSGLVGW